MVSRIKEYLSNLNPWFTLGIVVSSAVLWIGVNPAVAVIWFIYLSMYIVVDARFNGL